MIGARDRSLRPVLRDLRVSVAGIAGVVVSALIGLGLDGNWPKVMRVSLSFTAYASVLLALAWRARDSDRAPWLWFVAAGAAAGLGSGLLQPVFRFDVLIVGALGAGLLLGTMHWLGVRYWRALLRGVGVHPENDGSAEA